MRTLAIGIAVAISATGVLVPTVANADVGVRETPASYTASTRQVKLVAGISGIWKQPVRKWTITKNGKVVVRQTTKNRRTLHKALGRGKYKVQVRTKARAPKVISDWWLGFYDFKCKHRRTSLTNIRPGYKRYKITSTCRNRSGPQVYRGSHVFNIPQVDPDEIRPHGDTVTVRLVKGKYKRWTENRTFYVRGKNTPHVDGKEFGLIKSGMSRAQVKKIIGANGRLTYAGHGFKHVQYKTARKYGGVLVQYYNGRVTSKSRW